jgi:DNA polymerase III epsilon subunit-like protein
VNLSPAQRELFELLTQRTLYVVDTEYTGGRDSNRLISIAVVPIVGGRRAPATEELYVEMNPTAPISAGASAVNGFTDQMVARKRRFGHYAPAIIAAFADPEGVFVQHTSADIRVLLGELELLGPAAGSLPSMPLIDTSVLPRLLR